MAVCLLGIGGLFVASRGLSPGPLEQGTAAEIQSESESERLSAPARILVGDLPMT